MYVYLNIGCFLWLSPQNLWQNKDFEHAYQILNYNSVESTYYENHNHMQIIISFA